MQNVKLTPFIFGILVLMGSLGQFAADIYAPSLPAISKAFAVSSAEVQITMSVFMLAFAISQLFYGPWSDKVGRRKPVLNGILLALVGSIACLLAPNIYVLMAGRFLQGLGAGVTLCLGRVILRDIMSGTQLAKFGSFFNIIFSTVVAIAPMLGGYLQDYFDWRASFIFLLLYGICLFIIIWRAFPETHFNLNPLATKVSEMTKNYLILLKCRTFIGYVISSSCAYSGLVCYMTVASFLLQRVVGLTASQFGWLSFVTAAAVSSTAFINSRLVAKKGINYMVNLGNLLMLLSGITMLTLALFGLINVWVIMIPMVFFSMGCGCTFANAFAGAFHPFPHMAGSAGALYGCLQILGTSLAIGIIALAHTSNQLPLAIMLFSLGLISRLSMRYLVGNA